MNTQKTLLDTIKEFTFTQVSINPNPGELDVSAACSCGNILLQSDSNQCETCMGVCSPSTSDAIDPAPAWFDASYFEELEAYYEEGTSHAA